MENRALFVGAKEPKSGTLTILLGLMELLKSRFYKVAFFKPLVKEGEIDRDIELMIKHFRLKHSYEDAFAMSVEDAAKLLAEGKNNFFYEKIIEKFRKLGKEYDFVLCAGVGQDRVEALFDYDINIQIAKNLAVPFVGIVNAKDKDLHSLDEEIKLWFNLLKSEGVSLFSLFANRVNRFSIEDAKRLTSSCETDIFFIPENEELSKPTILDVAEHLKLSFLNESADERIYLRTINGFKVAAMRVDHFLERIEEGDLIITPGDRADILLAAVGTNMSKNYPSIAGILLSGGLRPEESVRKLLEGMDYFKIPIMIGKDDTYLSAMKASRAQPVLSFKNPRKVALSIALFMKYADKRAIERGLKKASLDVVTPAMFEYMIFEKASRDPKKVILPEVEDDRILTAAEIILNRNLAKVVFLSSREELEYRAEMIGVNLKEAQVIDPNDRELKERMAKKYYSLRLCKGITYEEALDAMENPVYLSTMLVKEGIVDAMVSGATHTTRETIKPAFEIIKTKEDVLLVSSVFFMCLETKVLVYADCAVNPDPTPEELAQIAISSAETAKKFSIEPIVAMLSYSSGDSGVGKDVEKVKKATEIAKKRRPDLLIDGPMQYDAAIDMEVGKRKMPNSKVAGRANVFIFPDLNTGNNTYKAVQRATNAIAIGPILQGLKKPVNDLSRGCLVDDIVSTVAITTIQAQED